MPGQAHNAGLMRECQAMLAAKDSLRGTAPLNWSVDTVITGWDGVTTSGTPSRVTELDLSSESLSGIVPPELEAPIRADIAGHELQLAHRGDSKGAG